MIFYINLGLVLYWNYIFTFFKKNELNKKIYLIICTLQLGLISGLRCTPWYTDYANYCADFKRNANLNFYDIFMSEKEIGQKLLMKIISIFTDNPQWYFFITSLFIVSIFMYFIYKYSSNVSISVFLFIVLNSYMVSQNIVRQYIAIALFMISLKFLINRNLIKYSISIFIATLFHSSAFLMIPFYFILNLNFKNNFKKKYCIYSLLGFISSIIFINIGMKNVYNYYEDTASYGQNSASILGSVIPIFIFIIMFIYLNKIYFLKEYNFIFLNMSIFNLNFVILSILNFLIIQRLGAYFNIAYLIIVPEFLKISIRYEKVITIFIYIIGILYFLVMAKTGRIPIEYSFGYLW